MVTKEEWVEYALAVDKLNEERAKKNNEIWQKWYDRQFVKRKFLWWKWTERRYSRFTPFQYPMRSKTVEGCLEWLRLNKDIQGE